VTLHTDKMRAVEMSYAGKNGRVKRP